MRGVTEWNPAGRSSSEVTPEYPIFAHRTCSAVRRWELYNGHGCYRHNAAWYVCGGRSCLIRGMSERPELTCWLLAPSEPSHSRVCWLHAYEYHRLVRSGSILLSYRHAFRRRPASRLHLKHTPTHGFKKWLRQKSLHAEQRPICASDWIAKSRRARRACAQNNLGNGFWLQPSLETP